ncbi:FCD domain-containing protein [Oricola sp.]|uniref:FadR/GntR family transcriptional regulator n=1 Tax=Oricola sp. TaxID=1979950 RepID=UPI002600375D|nr:FCD domain-containing protein [Oricola sp.]MCI5075380.1 FCD domain-containing protein [Oricola sp.]
MSENLVTRTISKSDQVASLLLKTIVDSDLRLGDSLGTESELIQKYGVSRPTLRESLRILESQGVIAMRPGPRGGILVRRPNVEFVAHALSLYLRLNEVPFIEIVKARLEIEPSLAHNAAEFGTAEDFDEMQASIDRMKKNGNDPMEFASENRVFHACIAKASKSAVLETFWTVLSIVASGERHGMRYTEKNRRAIVEYHQKILNACRDRDRDLAAKLMKEHIGELDHLLRTRFKDLSSEPTDISARPNSA